MTKREKMLLGIMGTAVIVGVGMFLMPGSGRVGLPKGQDAAVTVAKSNAEAQAKMVKDAGASALEAQVADMALRPWNTTVFYDKPLDIQSETVRDASMPAYTGYVEVGALRLAIIDGYEYREGDELETGSFLVEQITPPQVTLRGIDNGKFVRLPYQDPSFFTQ
ncbi:hypothetical protein ASZ90_000731 [hydrocarbon metagenome]|uniref:Uncharacterized protein n=1 Tax=hydrocarbon metagenome TaxID=938273 RepID=A0A0W8G8N9_9ZZZZ